MGEFHSAGCGGGCARHLAISAHISAHISAYISASLLRERGERVVIKVVGRLIERNKVRLGPEGGSEDEALALTAGELLHLPNREGGASPAKKGRYTRRCLQCDRALIVM